MNTLYWKLDLLYEHLDRKSMKLNTLYGKLDQFYEYLDMYCGILTRLENWMTFGSNGLP